MAVFHRLSAAILGTMLALACALPTNQSAANRQTHGGVSSSLGSNDARSGLRSPDQPSDSESYKTDRSWESYKAKYQKTYKDEAVEASRHNLFTIAKCRVAQLNKLNGQPAFGINWMSDRFPHEKHKTGHRKPKGWVPTAPVKEFGAPRKP